MHLSHRAVIVLTDKTIDRLVEGWEFSMYEKLDKGLDKGGSGVKSKTMQVSKINRLKKYFEETN